MSTHLNNAALDLENSLKRSVKFYVRVGWLKEDKPVLMVYYDQRHDFPQALPVKWSGYEVRSQPTLPPGAKAPVDTAFLPW